MKKLFYYLALVLLCSVSCVNKIEKESPELKSEIEELSQRKYLNFAIKGVMSEFYLWNKEIADRLESWSLEDNPQEKVFEVRYKDSFGKDVDHWTKLYDNIEEYVNGTNGTSTSFGMMLRYYTGASDKIIPIVMFVYKDSPAEKAGLKRGSAIDKINGKELNNDNFNDVISDFIGSDKHCILTLLDGSIIEMDPINMYFNPIIRDTVFTFGDYKIGYLHYTSFTNNSCQDLINVCTKLKAENINDLILDLRYNGGGYLLTEELLASLLAPKDVVNSKAVLHREIYNSDLQEFMEDDSVAYFNTSFSYDNKKYDTSNANLNLNKLYVICSCNSASASELLIGSLNPYMDIITIGERTSGKYCIGSIIDIPELYEDNAEKLGKEFAKRGAELTNNWGLYLMIARYADCNGITLSMPNGIETKYSVKEYPLDGYDLGDPNETITAFALSLAVPQTKSANISKKSSIPFYLTPAIELNQSINNPYFGVLISN